MKKNGMENTQVVLSGEALGGEGTVVSSARSRARYGQGTPGKNYYADSYASRRVRFLGACLAVDKVLRGLVG